MSLAEDDLYQDVVMDHKRAPRHFGTLPAPTRIVMGISDFIRAYWWALAGGAFALTWIFKRYRATDGNDIWIAIGWCLGLLVVGYALAMRTYHRTLG